MGNNGFNDSPLAIAARAEAPGAQELIGPFFLGVILNYLLWGIQITQSYFYYKTYRDTDRMWIKAAVFLLFVTDLIESICITATGWRFLVEGWGDMEGVALFPGWGLSTTPIMDAFTASIVHFFYAQKIWTLLDAPYHFLATGLVVALSILQLSAGIGCTLFMFYIKITLPQFERIKVWATIWLVTAAVTDIVITALMTLKLSKSRTGFKRTDDLITKAIMSSVIRLTVETGLATAVVQIVDVLTYRLWPLKAYHIVPAFVGPKVYSNSMLALLNSRQQRKANGVMWESNSFAEAKPVEGIHITTTQTVHGSREEYELDSKPHAIRTPSRTTDNVSSFTEGAKDAKWAA